MDEMTIQAIIALVGDLTFSGLALLWVFSEIKAKKQVQDRYDNLTDKLLDVALYKQKGDSEA